MAQAHLASITPPNTLGQTSRLAALVSVSNEGLQMLRRQGRNALIDALRVPLRAQFEPLAVPRIWCFFEQIPLNAQGKLTHAALHDAVHNRPTLPEVVPSQPANTPSPFERYYILRVPYDLSYFSGHFAKMPVVPGVAQIGWALHFAQQDLLPALSPQFRFGGIEILKFQRLIRPADSLLLSLRFDAEPQKLYFAFTSADHACSSGRILNAAR